MADAHVNSRLEAFCDGVFAIALTLLIIDIRIPASAHVETTDDLWRAIAHIAPAMFAFVLSFAIILITWVNHHAALRLVDKSSPAFIYANGLLLLTVVCVPFPTSLLGEYLATDHSSPAVVLYSSVCAFQAIAWNVLTRTALAPKLLTRGETSTRAMRKNHKYSYPAFVLYTACAIVAVWFPHTIAFAISVIWLVWLMLSVTMKTEAP